MVASSEQTGSGITFARHKGREGVVPDFSLAAWLMQLVYHRAVAQVLILGSLPYHLPHSYSRM